MKLTLHVQLSKACFLSHATNSTPIVLLGPRAGKMEAESGGSGELKRYFKIQTFPKSKVVV